MSTGGRHRKMFNYDKLTRDKYTSIHNSEIDFNLNCSRIDKFKDEIWRFY